MSDLYCTECSRELTLLQDDICGFCAEKLQSRIAELEAEVANLNDWLTAWKESLTIAQAEIAKLEKQLKSQIELHETWHVTYRIKLDYIDELENKLKRSGLL